MNNKKFVVVVCHGESKSVFHVVDSSAPEGEQPAVTYSFSKRSDAEAFAELLNEKSIMSSKDRITKLIEDFASRVYGLLITSKCVEDHALAEVRNIFDTEVDLLIDTIKNGPEELTEIKHG